MTVYLSINAALGRLAAGDGLLFGSYPQDSDAREPILWRALDISDGRALMLSEYVLDARRYDEKSSVWETSELRRWLLGKFAGKAFNDEERNMLSAVSGDAVTLLDQEQAEKYLDGLSRPTPEGWASYPGRMAEFTPHAEDRASSGTGKGWWWLRSRYERDICTEFVDRFGIIYHSEGGVIRSVGGVRPVIALTLPDAEPQ